MAVRVAFLPAGLEGLRAIGSAVTRAAVRLAAARTTARVDLFFMIAGLLRAGLDLRRTLDIAIRRAESGSRSAEVFMLRSWQRGLANGRLADELSLWLPASESVIFSGYGRGSIQPLALFEAAARIAEMKARLIAGVVKALSMPALIAVCLVLLLWMVGSYVLPVLAGISDSARWGPLTILFYDVTTWVSANEIVLACGLLGTVALVWVAVVCWSGWGRTAADRFPPFSLYRLITGWSFLAVMLEFLRVGIDLSDDTFLRIEQTAPPYVRSRIAMVRRQMGGGHPFGRSMRLAGTSFPDSDLIAVIEALEGLPEWHLRTAEFLQRWIERAERVLAAQLGLARTALMMLCAVVIGGTVNSMFDVLGQIQ